MVWIYHIYSIYPEQNPHYLCHILKQENFKHIYMEKIAKK